MTDYTPKTEEVRDEYSVHCEGWCERCGESDDVSYMFHEAEFDRWLAEVKAQAVEKAANRESDWRSGYWHQAEAETVVKIRKGLLKHAQRIRQGEEQ